MLNRSFNSGYVQGGSDGMPIVGDFAIKYASHASSLGVDPEDLWNALVDTAENTVGNRLKKMSLIWFIYSSLFSPRTG